MSGEFWTQKQRSFVTQTKWSIRGFQKPRLLIIHCRTGAQHEHGKTSWTKLFNLHPWVIKIQFLEGSLFFFLTFISVMALRIQRYNLFKQLCNFWSEVVPFLPRPEFKEGTSTQNTTKISTQSNNTFQNTNAIYDSHSLLNTEIHFQCTHSTLQHGQNTMTTREQLVVPLCYSRAPENSLLAEWHFVQHSLY